MIKVQPIVISRKKPKIGSRQRESNVETKSVPNRLIRLKRKYNIKEIIDLNILSVKKAGWGQWSVTQSILQNKIKI